MRYVTYIIAEAKREVEFLLVIESNFCWNNALTGCINAALIGSIKTLSPVSNSEQRRKRQVYISDTVVQKLHH